MQGVYPFQRRDATSVRILTTIGVSSLATLQLSGNVIVEIANLSTTEAAAFVFTGASASSATPASTNMRTIPPATVLHEFIPGGISSVSAVALSGTPTLVFTPGVING